MALWPIPDDPPPPHLTNKVRKKETNEDMHGRNIRSGQDLNQLPREPRANTITTEPKRILPNAVVRYCI